jgi:NAD(P)-dependent dehydrogenase (short-subunit alcohol dehydrogenase family)
MFEDLKGKNVIITGGLGFLGRQIINALSEEGSNIIILDKKKKTISKKFEHFYCDISKKKNLSSVSRRILKKYKKIDILINNAANNHSIKDKINSFENFQLEIWDKDILVGLTGCFLCTQIFGTIMSKQKTGGNIINISSDLGIIAPDQRLYEHTKSFKKPVSYSVVKHGIIGLTKYTASYWAKKNIRCNAFAPGGIFNNQDKIFISKIKKLIPLNRMAMPNEHNKTILFLASNASSYITGSIIISDGGRTII